MEDETTLVKSILDGDVAAWHRFVEIHNDQMQSIINRYVNDQDIRRDLFVSLLEKLRGQKLAHFDGRSTLSTWLFVVTVNHCRDYFRSAKGIRHVLTALKGLRKIERRFFKLAFVQGMPIHEVLDSIRAEMGEHITYLDLIECEERIVVKAREKKLGRLIEKLLSPAIKQQQLDGAALAVADKEHLAVLTQPPLDIIVEGDLFQKALQNLRDALLNLPYRDQIILKLKFEHKASARRICEVLDLGNERMVYRRLEKLLTKLKGMLLETGIPLEIYEGIVQNLAELRSWVDVWNEHPEGDGPPLH